MDVKNYYCQYCAVSQPRLDIETGRLCRMYNKPVKDTDFCSFFTKALWTCDCCGNQFIGDPYILMEGDDTTFSMKMLICGQCNQQLNTCHTCKHQQECAFENDPSPLPKVVQKQVKQGNMIAVTQVMNPERVAITCEKGCPCWSPDFGCAKQNHGTCQQYHIRQALTDH